MYKINIRNNSVLSKNTSNVNYFPEFMKPGFPGIDPGSVMY